MLDITMLAFDLAFKYRNPVVILGDGYLGQMTGKVRLPREMVQARHPRVGRLRRPLAPRQPHLLDQPLRGGPRAAQHAPQRQVRAHDRGGAAGRPVPLRRRRGAARRVQHPGPAGQGRGRRSCASKGVKAGLFRPITLWPFPIDALCRSLPRVSRLVMVEASAGQLEDELRLALSHAGVHAPPPITHVAASGGVLPAAGRDRRSNVLGRKGCSDAQRLLPTIRAPRPRRGPQGAQHALLRRLRPRVVHKYLAEAIDELGMQDRTIARIPRRLLGVRVLLLRRRQHAGRPRPRARRRHRPQDRQPRRPSSSATRATKP